MNQELKSLEAEKMTEKQKYAIKLAIDTMDKYNSRYWNTRYGSLKTGVSVWYGEAISILSDMVRDNDNKLTNADSIRNMSDEELAEWINTKNMCEQCANYYEPDSECMGEPCASNILRWLQSEAE
jgi:hypothetical protein